MELMLIVAGILMGVLFCIMIGFVVWPKILDRRDRRNAQWRQDEDEAREFFDVLRNRRMPP